MRKGASYPTCSLTYYVLLTALLFTTLAGQSQTRRQREITNVNISPQISQYLEHLPPGYNDAANINKKYPLIIYWHGLYEATSYTGGTMGALYVKGVPQKIETRVFPDTVYNTGMPYSYVVITPQYTNDGANASDVNAAIDYILNRYRVDRNRVYMTGISKGAGLCYSFANANPAWAKKVAAIAPLAPCEALSWGGGANVVNAKMHIWGLHCPADNICNVGSTIGSVNNVNSQNPAPAPVLAKYTLTPAWDPNYPHDIFWMPYEPGYTTPESDGKNMYQWFITYSQNQVLPVSLKDFTARLHGGKVRLDWMTSAENNSGLFTVERAGADMQFSQIAKVNAASFSSADKKYQAIDNAPLSGMNFYRLSQTDKDGKTQYFEVRRVMNGKQKNTIVISPNPVRSRITAFIQVDEPQKLSISLTDMQGRLVSNTQTHYQQGLQEIVLNAAHLAPGTYIVKVKGSTVNVIEKLVKE